MQTGILRFYNQWNQKQKASRAEGKCVSYCLCCADCQNYQWYPTKSTPYHISELKALPKVFWRWNSYWDLVSASYMSVWLGALPYPDRNPIKMSLPTDGRSLFGVWQQTHFITLCFPVFSGLHSSNLLVSQQSYGGMILGWKKQLLSSWNSQLTGRDRYINKWF